MFTFFTDKKMKSLYQSKLSYELNLNLNLAYPYNFFVFWGRVRVGFC